MTFITLEGGEGAGKGSVQKALAALLRRAGADVLVTREPGGSPEGSRIRALVVESGGAEWDPLCELLLLMADRAQHCARVIRPALSAGRTVICDRFEASTFAYQGAGKGIRPDLIASLQATVAEGLEPDLTLLLDVDPEVGLARSARRLQTIASREDRFETLDLAFHGRVRASFLEQARRNPQRWLLIDASRPLSTVLADAERRVADRLGLKIER